MALFRRDFRILVTTYFLLLLNNNGLYSCANKWPDILIIKSAAKYKI